jgi:hypothetical protein
MTAQTETNQMGAVAIDALRACRARIAPQATSPISQNLSKSPAMRIFHLPANPPVASIEIHTKDGTIV